MEKLEEWMDKYFDMFEEGFPTYQLARTRTEDECIEIIKKCLDQKKDVYELGYIKDDDVF